ATTVYVTHDQAEALAMGDRVAVLERGRLIQVGRTADVYGHPASRFVGEFLGDPPMSMIPCEVQARESGPRVSALGFELELPQGGRGARWSEGIARGEGLSYDLGVRPEHVRFVPVGREGARDPLLAWFPDAFVVRSAEFLGHETVVTAELGPRVSVSARLPS